MSSGIRMKPSSVSCGAGMPLSCCAALLSAKPAASTTTSVVACQPHVVRQFGLPRRHARVGCRPARFLQRLPRCLQPRFPLCLHRGDRDDARFAGDLHGQPQELPRSVEESRRRRQSLGRGDQDVRPGDSPARLRPVRGLRRGDFLLGFVPPERLFADLFRP